MGLELDCGACAEEELGGGEERVMVMVEAGEQRLGGAVEVRLWYQTRP